MPVVLLLAFVGGALTGVSPCILPVLPVVLAGSAAGTDRRRPYAIVTGLVLSFCLFTLVAGALLRLLHLPQDFLRDAGPYALLVLAAALMVPAFGDLLERPFARLSARLPQPRLTSGRSPAPSGGAGVATQVTARPPGTASGFLLGGALGLVFVPCAGPVLAAITVAAERERFGAELVFVTLAYGLGIAVPLAVVARLGRGAATRLRSLRQHVPVVRRVAGLIIALLAVALIFNVTTSLQTSFPGSSHLEDRVESSLGAGSTLRSIDGEHSTIKQSTPAQDVSLPELGRAPNFTGITAWIGTPHGRPLTLAQLRGKVVLVDFWTYSCINCLRSLPHVEGWYRDYRKDGFVVVGVHSPEFPFEHVVSNVRAAVARLGVHYPVAVDDNLDTWSAYGNQYWPAEYLIDENGEVRHTQFGEGDYGTTENDIRMLLTARPGPGGRPVTLPAPTDTPNRTPDQPSTPESYLGYERLDNDVGTPVRDNVATSYQLSQSVPADSLSFGGTWTVHTWEATAGADAQLALNFEAQDVYLVLGGHGTVSVSLNGRALPSVRVSGIPDLYTLVSLASTRTGLLQLKFPPGVQAYDFTFG